MIERNVFFESLPSYGYIDQIGQTYVWHGHRRGRGRERAVVSWDSLHAALAQAKLDGMVAKFRLAKPEEYTRLFGVRP